jgi:hypothetical protein
LADDFSKFWIDGLIPDEQVNKQRIVETLHAKGLDDTKYNVSQEQSNKKRRLEKATKDFLQSLDEIDSFYQEVKRKNLSNYNLIVNFNIVMFVVGVALLIVSSAYSILNQKIDNITLVTAGLGAANFIAIFLINPQIRIRRMHSDFVQMGIIYNTWLHQAQSAWLPLIRSDFADDQIVIFQRSMGRFSSTAIRAIEKYTEGLAEVEVTQDKKDKETAGDERTAGQ